MRSSTIFVVLVVLGALYFWQKHRDESPAPDNQPKAPVAAAQLTPAPRGVASENNWMKRSIDRAADVRDMARARTKEAQDP
jgi:hypothetical protein